MNKTAFSNKPTSVLDPKYMQIMTATFCHLHHNSYKLHYFLLKYILTTLAWNNEENVCRNVPLKNNLSKLILNFNHFNSSHGMFGKLEQECFDLKKKSLACDCGGMIISWEWRVPLVMDWRDFILNQIHDLTNGINSFLHSVDTTSHLYVNLPHKSHARQFSTKSEIQTL